MIRRVIRALISNTGFVLGFTTYLSLTKEYKALIFGSELRGFIISIAIGLILALVFYKLEPWFINKTKELVKILDIEISKYPPGVILLASIGLIIGLIIAYLISA